MRALRPAEYPRDPCVTGPHVVADGDGGWELVWRCERCGTSSDDPALLRGCWVCDGPVAWR